MRTLCRNHSTVILIKIKLLLSKKKDVPFKADHHATTPYTLTSCESLF